MKNTDRIKEELLVLRCMQGDRQAFEEIAGLWQERLYRHAYHLTGESDAAWDAVQETWVAVVDGLPKLREAAAFGGWIYRILAARCADWVRRQQRQRKLVDSISVTRESDQTPCEHIALRQTLGRLPADRREILSLRYAVGYDTAEIARILGIPEGTVKSRLHNAREELRRLMEMQDERQTR